jgi:predicted GIY-YIG superfamily endonuclease
VGSLPPTCGACFFQLGNNDIYVGSTNDRRRRIAAQSIWPGSVDKCASTEAQLPGSVKSYSAAETEKRARELEDCLKSGSGKAFAKKGFRA